MLQKYQLNFLKSKIKSIDDLKEFLIREKIEFTETELKQAYDEVLNYDQEVSLDELENISGGKKQLPIGDCEYSTVLNYVRYWCKFCGKLVWFPTNCEYAYPCPACGKKQKYDKHNKDC